MITIDNVFRYHCWINDTTIILILSSSTRDSSHKSINAMFPVYWPALRIRRTQTVKHHFNMAIVSHNVFISEMEQILNSLEQRTIVTRFYLKKKPEQRTLRLRRETRQILWSRTSNTNNKNYDGCCNYNVFTIVFILLNAL